MNADMIPTLAAITAIGPSCYLLLKPYTLEPGCTYIYIWCYKLNVILQQSETTVI